MSLRQRSIAYYSNPPSSNTNAALALFKKGAQLRQIILAGLQGYRVDIVPAEHPRKFLLSLVHETAKARSRRAVGCVDLNLIAGFSVFQRNDTDVWQHSFPFIVNRSE